MNSYDRSHYNTPYSQICSQDELEWRKEQDRLDRDASDELEAKFEREKVAEWVSARGKRISLHFDPKDKVIFVWFDFLDLSPFSISSLRRPTEQERKSNPDLYALLDDGETRIGLTKERYMALRQKLPETTGGIA